MDEKTKKRIKQCLNINELEVMRQLSDGRESLDYAPDMSRAASSLYKLNLLDRKVKGKKVYWTMTEAGEKIYSLLKELENAFQIKAVV